MPRAIRGAAFSHRPVDRGMALGHRRMGLASTTTKAKASPQRHSQRRPQPVSASIVQTGAPAASTIETSWMAAVCTKSWAIDAASNSPAPAQVSLEQRDANSRPVSRTEPAACRPNNTGRHTNNSNTSPPTIANTAARMSQRNSGSAGDWSSGSSGTPTGKLPMGWPTENRNEPWTRWPSTVETFFQATL